MIFFESCPWVHAYYIFAFPLPLMSIYLKSLLILWCVLLVRGNSLNKTTNHWSLNHWSLITLFSVPDPGHFPLWVCASQTRSLTFRCTCVVWGLYYFISRWKQIINTAPNLRQGCQLDPRQEFQKCLLYNIAFTLQMADLIITKHVSFKETPRTQNINVPLFSFDPLQIREHPNPQVLSSKALVIFLFLRHTYHKEFFTFIL